MNDGGREESTRSAKTKHIRGDCFVRAVARIAVAQICESEGFQSFQSSALEGLADVAVRYVEEAGKRTSYYSELAGRTDCCVFDVIRGLEDLCFTQGFAGAPDVRRCLASSDVVREIAQYISLKEDIPFAYSLPGFPVAKDCKLPPSFQVIGEEPPYDHLPPWLPAFPDPSTYAGVKGGQTADKKAEEAHQERKADLPSMNLENALKVRGVNEVNPFLAPPHPYGEKEVSPVILPSRLNEEAMGMDGDSLVANEAGNSILIGSDERKKEICSLDQRPRVCLNLSGRKFSAQRKDEVQKPDFFLESDDEKDA